MPEAPLRVLFLAGRLGPREAGALRRRADRLAAEGAAARLVCASGIRGWGEGLPARELPALAVRWAAPWAVRRLARGDDEPRPDLIHARGVETARVGLDLADRWRIPYVLSIEEFLPPGGRLRLGRGGCGRVIATGWDLADDLVEALGLPRRAVAVIPPGIDPPQSPPLRAGGPAWRVPVIGAACRLGTGAGLATFLEAARIVRDAGRDAEFVIAGGGPGEAALRRLADGLGIADRVTIADAVAAGCAFWDVLDLYVQPALRPEAGRALAQALARGLPAIASDVAGLRPWIEPGRTGWLVARGDAAGLARAILDRLDDPAGAASVGRRARDAIARACDPGREAAALAALYREVIACGPLARRGRLRADPPARGAPSASLRS